MSSATMEARRAAIVSAPGEGRPIYVMGIDITMKIASSDAQDAFNVFEAIVPPLAGPPMHRHRHQDEIWLIHQGEFRFVVDGQEIHARTGDTVYAPRGTEHTFQNVGQAPGHMLITVVPGGLDEFFDDVEAAAPRGSAPDPAKLLPVYDRHGLEMLGPPLPAPVERAPGR